MPAITRVRDVSAGHCFFPRPPSAGSPDVFVNDSIPAVRVGDTYPVHSCGSASHGGAASAGSSTVFINGQPVHRIGDAISCGDVSASGSPNVFAGG